MWLLGSGLRLQKGPLLGYGTTGFSTRQVRRENRDYATHVDATTFPVDANDSEGRFELLSGGTLFVSTIHHLMNGALRFVSTIHHLMNGSLTDRLFLVTTK